MRLLWAMATHALPKLPHESVSVLVAAQVLRLSCT